MQLTKNQSVKVIEDLISYDYLQKEVILIKNSVELKNKMLLVRDSQVGELTDEIEKRDVIISRMNYEFSLQEKILKKQLKRSSINKWLYLGLGAGFILVIR